MQSYELHMSNGEVYLTNADGHQHVVNYMADASRASRLMAVQKRKGEMIDQDTMVDLENLVSIIRVG